MLCLSGFELYSRCVPLICLEVEVIFEKIAWFSEMTCNQSGSDDGGEKQKISDSTWERIC